MRAKRSRGKLRGFSNETCNCSGIEREHVHIGALGVGVILIGRRALAREIDERVPKAARAEEALARSIFALEAQRVARRSAAGFEDYLSAIFGTKRARGLRIGVDGEQVCQIHSIGLDCIPPVAIGIEDDSAGVEDLLNALWIFSDDADDHVDEFGRPERLANERTNADELGVVF